MSIPVNGDGPRHAAGTGQHPRWCAGAPVCSAFDVETDVALRQHRGPTFGFRAPAFDVELTLIQAQVSYPTDVHLVAVVSKWAYGPAEAGKVGVTLAVADAWRLLDAVSGLLEQVR